MEICRSEASATGGWQFRWPARLVVGQHLKHCREVAGVHVTVDLYLATPGPNRSRFGPWSVQQGEGGAGRGEEADRRVGDRAGDLKAGDGVAAGEQLPKRRFSAVAVMAAEKLPVQVACRVVGVSESGYYEWRGRGPSERAIRHAWLTDLIRDVHAESRAPTAGGASTLSSPSAGALWWVTAQSRC